MRRTGLVAAGLLASGCLESTTGEVKPLDERFTQGAQDGGRDGGSGSQNQAPFAGIEGERVTLSGVISAELTLPVDVDFRQDDPDSPGGRRSLGKLALQQAGAFSLEVPAGFGTVLLEAFQDLGADGPTDDDPYGWMTLEIGDVPLEGVAITLVEGALVAARQELTGSGGGLGWGAVTGPMLPVVLTLTSDVDAAIDVDLRGAGDGNIGKLNQPRPGQLQFEVPASYGALRIQAFQDLTGDGPSDDDPFGWVNLVVGDTPVPEQTLSLVVGGKLALAAALGHGGGATVGGGGPFDAHEGPLVTLSGTLSGVTEGGVALDLRRLDASAPGGNEYLGKLPLAGPGPFSVQVPAELGALSIQAFQDQTGDGPSDDDPFGFLEVQVGTGPVSGLSLVVEVGGKARLAASLGHGGGEGGALPFSDYNGARVAVAGTLSSDAAGPIEVDLRRPDPAAPGGNVHVGKLTIASPGPFRIDVPSGLGTLMIQAFQDQTGDGPSDDDPFGFVDVEVGAADLGGVALPLSVGGKARLAAALGHGGGGAAQVPFADHTGPWTTLSGELAGVSDGTVDMDLRVPDATEPGGNRQIGKLKLQVAGGRYAIQVPRGLGTLMIEIFQDLTSDGPSLDDPYASATLTVDDVAALSQDLRLVVGARGAPGAGGGEGGGGGGGGTVFTEVGDAPVTISGVLSLSPAVREQVGKAQIDLDVFSQDAGSEAGRSLLGKLKLAPGPFSFKAPRDFGVLELEAYVDLDGDGPTPGDPFGTCGQNPVRVDDSDVGGLTVLLGLTGVAGDGD